MFLAMKNAGIFQGGFRMAFSLQEARANLLRQALYLEPIIEALSLYFSLTGS